MMRGTLLPSHRWGSWDLHQVSRERFQTQSLFLPSPLHSDCGHPNFSPAVELTQWFVFCSRGCGSFQKQMKVGPTSRWWFLSRKWVPLHLVLQKTGPVYFGPQDHTEPYLVPRGKSLLSGMSLTGLRNPRYSTFSSPALFSL